MRTLLVCAFTGALLGCGPANNTPPDAGPDTSCGLDCAAQARFGLIVNRCFEYSTGLTAKEDPPAMGAWVKPVFTLEGGVKVLPVEYRQGGQMRMIDSFGIVDGTLRLMRREFSGSSQSVTYKDTDNAITGVRWFPMDVAEGQTVDSTSSAFVVGSSGAGTSTPTTYKVTTVAGTSSQLRTPLETYSQGLQIIFSETPNHGSDSQRTFVPDVGFVVIASDFSLTQGTPTPLRLQRIRDIGTPDGGTVDCSLGAP